MPFGRAVSSGPAGHLLPQAGEGKWVRPSAGSWVGRGEGDREISHKLPLILSFSRREKGPFVLCREQNMRENLFDGVPTRPPIFSIRSLVSVPVAPGKRWWVLGIWQLSARCIRWAAPTLVCRARYSWTVGPGRVSGVFQQTVSARSAWISTAPSAWELQLTTPSCLAYGGRCNEPNHDASWARLS